MRPGPVFADDIKHLVHAVEAGSDDTAVSAHHPHHAPALQRRVNPRDTTLHRPYRIPYHYW